MLPAVAEDLSSVPSTNIQLFTTALTPAPLLMPSSGICGYLHSWSQNHKKMNTHTYAKKIKK